MGMFDNIVFDEFTLLDEGMTKGDYIKKKIADAEKRYQDEEAADENRYRRNRAQSARLEIKDRDSKKEEEYLDKAQRRTGEHIGKTGRSNYSVDASNAMYAAKRNEAKKAKRGY